MSKSDKEDKTNITKEIIELENLTETSSNENESDKIIEAIQEKIKYLEDLLNQVLLKKRRRKRRI